MTDAQDRGWGDPGDPGSRTAGEYRRRNIVPVLAGDVTWYVHLDIAKLVRYLVEEVIIPAIGPIDTKADDWSYANRCVRGTGSGTGKRCVRSFHAFGLAIDVNATQNVRGGPRHGEFPPDMGERVRRLGFGWGGDFRSVADPMHFEFTGTPDNARRITAELEDDMTLEAKLDAMISIGNRLLEALQRVEHGKKPWGQVDDVGVRDLAARLDVIAADVAEIKART